MRLKQGQTITAANYPPSNHPQLFLLKNKWIRTWLCGFIGSWLQPAHMLWTPSHIQTIACFAEHKALYIKKDVRKSIPPFETVSNLYNFSGGQGLAPLRLPHVLQLSHSLGKFSTGKQSQWTSMCNLPAREKCVFSSFSLVFRSSGVRSNSPAVSAGAMDTRDVCLFSPLY